MATHNPIKELFDSLIEDETEKKIMRLIIEEKNPDEIIDHFLNINCERREK